MINSKNAKIRKMKKAIRICLKTKAVKNKISQFLALIVDLVLLTCSKALATI